LYVFYLLRFFYIYNDFLFGGEERWGNLMEKNYLGDPGIDGRIIFAWVFK
jgi:hypothetical protein